MHALSRRLVLMSCAWLATSALAADPARGTRDEAKALAEAAAAHVNTVGSEQAFKDFADAKWHPKDMYIFAQDLSATMLYHWANPKLVGKNFIDVRDSGGKDFNKDMIAAAKKGGGWADYQWAHPVTKKVEDKTSYIQKISKPEGFVGVGIYR